MGGASPKVDIRQMVQSSIVLHQGNSDSPFIQQKRPDQTRLNPDAAVCTLLGYH